MSREAGKGSKQRPTDHETYSYNWDMIFKKEKAKQITETGAGSPQEND